MIDLFRTHKELLLAWMRQKGYFSSVDITEWGLKNYYLRAPRTLRDFCKQGIVRRLDAQEKLFRGFLKEGNKNIGWYECKNA